MKGNHELCLLSIDLEDWFQTENLSGVISKKDWDSFEIRAGERTERLLDILDKHHVKATFFILGWVAERLPGLVREIYEKGHEIASHGYGHDLVYRLDEPSFRKDIRKSKEILQAITGQEILGYRAPSFSITDWAIQVLKQEGFRYDSSFFPTNLNSLYGKLPLKGKTLPIEKLDGDFYEVKLSTLDVFGLALPWSGGGYFRLAPYGIFKSGIRKILAKSGTFLFYLHPWELDTAQPRVKGLRRSLYFRQYNGLEKTEKKFEALIRDFCFTSVWEGLKSIGLRSEIASSA